VQEEGEKAKVILPILFTTFSDSNLKKVEREGIKAQSEMIL
jgi:hypothetical protein